MLKSWNYLPLPLQTNTLVSMKQLLLPVLLVLLTVATTAQVPMNWYVDEVHPGQDITLNTDEETFTDGARSCRMQLNSGAVPYLVSNRFSVAPGTAYSFSIQALDNDTTGQIRVYADFFDEVGNMVFGEDPKFSGNMEGWQSLGWQGTVPPTAVEGYILIKFYCEPELTKFIDTVRIWVDDVRFTDQEGNNLVVNGSFELWAVGVDEPNAVRAPISVYPNPTEGPITVSNTAMAGWIRIFDLMGKQVMDVRTGGNETIRMDLQALPQGLYTLAAFRENALVSSVKVIRR